MDGEWDGWGKVGWRRVEWMVNVGMDGWMESEMGGGG